MSAKKIINKLKRKEAPKYVDLHLHTTKSDGLLTPEELVKTAYKLKYKTIAITDHDTLEGISEGREAAEKYGIEVIPGSELTAYYYNHEIHILEYFIEPDDKHFLKYLNKFKNARFERAKEMVRLLNKIGIDIDFNEIIKKYDSAALGRPHIARELVEKGYASEMQEAFKNFLVPGKPAYVPKYLIGPREIIQLIRDCNGIPVFAHPYYYFNYEALLKKMVDMGLMGIEVYHTYHPPHLVKKLKSLAKKYNLLITGGSDAHSGPKGKYLPFGNIRLPQIIAKNLRKARKIT